MTEKSSNPFEVFQISKDLLSAQQKFLPSGQIFEQAGEAVRILAQAQISYGQALMRANAALFGAFLRVPEPPTPEVRPSVAAREPEYAGS